MNECRIKQEHRAVPCAPSGDVLRSLLRLSGFQTRLAHRLQVYVPTAFRHSFVIRHSRFVILLAHSLSA
jgi:hypothetical protein